MLDSPVGWFFFFALNGFAALTRLGAACRAPADKAAVVVAAHKILVGTAPFFLLFFVGESVVNTCVIEGFPLSFLLSFYLSLIEGG